MGVGSSKAQKNFFDEIKTTTSYRDFVIKMNQLMAGRGVAWEFSLEQLNLAELDLYEDLFKHFLIFSAEFVYDHALRKSALEKDSFRMVRVFLDILQRLFVFMTVRRPRWFFESLWTRVNQDAVLEQVLDESGGLKNLKVDRRDYLGSEDQLPIGLRLLVALTELAFKNGFTIEYDIEDRARLANAVAQNGWNRAGNRSATVLNRISVLELVLTFVMVEKQMCEAQGRRHNAVISFFKSMQGFEVLLRSLLRTGCEYQENGVLPYSAYFYKEQMENQLYLAALALNLALVFLGEETEASRAEFGARDGGVVLFVTRTYMRNHPAPRESDLADTFNDEPFLKSVLEALCRNIISLYHGSKSILPNSFREVSSAEPVPRGERLPFARAAQQTRELPGRAEQAAARPQSDHPAADPARRGAPRARQRHLLPRPLAAPPVLLLSPNQPTSTASGSARTTPTTTSSPTCRSSRARSSTTSSATSSRWSSRRPRRTTTRSSPSSSPSSRTCELSSAVYAVDLRETTCLVIFDTLRLLENYVAIVRNPGVFATLNSLFAFLEKVVVYNWKAG